MTETRKSVVTKSIFYYYDIEYVKYYNYYESDFNQDKMANQELDENQNCMAQLELEEETELTDEFCECVDDVPERGHQSFSFVRVSKIHNVIRLLFKFRIVLQLEIMKIY